MARRGRRPGPSTARADILRAARRRFADQGYAATSLRSIADEAGVDPALVHHYFDAKQGLFAAAMELPFDPSEVVADVITGSDDELGERLVLAFLTTWDATERRDVFRAIFRSAATEDRAASMLKEFLVSALYRPIVDHAGSDQPDLRAALAASQIVGLAAMRYVFSLEPIVSSDARVLSSSYGPGVQASLTGPLHA